MLELIVGGLDPTLLGEEDLGAPHLLDSEVLHALRGLVLRDALTTTQADAALEGFLDLSIERFSADWLRTRIWELRHNLTAYDATYVALAELSAATELLTTDARLAAVAGARCAVRVV